MTLPTEHDGIAALDITEDDFLSGIGVGWNFENFNAAYGYEEPDLAAYRLVVTPAFAQGFQQGRDYYKANCWQDGTPQDDD